MLNKLLQKQIRKALGKEDALPEEYKELFQAISQSYDFYEKDRRMMERSIELSSDEMIGLYKQLKKETDETIQKSEANLELKNRELERKNKELEQFAYVASHDLQEPLRTITSFVELLKKQYYGQLDGPADKYLTYIVQASDRMRTLINDLLDYSRIGNKKELQKVDCNIILQELLADLGKSINDVRAVIKAEQLPVIWGYRTEIKQLFQNLLLNAIKFRKRNTIPQVSISAHLDGACWVFAVRDNGIGIEDAHRERIFVIFQRLHTRSEYEGSGIGLSHSKKIAELHGGKIWVESAPGIGAAFYFTIPEIRE